MHAVITVDKRDRSFILQCEGLIFRDCIFPFFCCRHRIVIDSREDRSVVSCLHLHGKSVIYRRLHHLGCLLLQGKSLADLFCGHLRIVFDISRRHAAIRRGNRREYAVLVNACSRSSKRQDKKSGYDPLCFHSSPKMSSELIFANYIIMPQTGLYLLIWGIFDV